MKPLPTVEKFLELIRHGVNWGPVEFKVRWQSPCKTMAIVTWPGGSTRSGIATREYCPTRHWVVDLRRLLDKSGIRAQQDCTIREFKGRLTRVQMQDLIATANRALATRVD